MSERPRFTRRRLRLAVLVSTVVVLPGMGLFTAVSQAATLPPVAAVAPTVSGGTSTGGAPVSSPPPCPTTNTPGFTPRPSGDPVPPTPPCRLSVSFHAPNQFTLSWGASFDNIAVTGYLVHDRDSQGVLSVREVPGDVGYLSMGAVPNDQHTYWVVARDAIGNRSGPSNAVTVGGGTVIATIDHLPPTAPSNLQVSVASGRATLTWTASTDNVGIQEYVVNDLYTDVVVLTRVHGSITTLTMSTTAPSQQHTWWVVARDPSGNTSPSSNRVQIGTPPTCPPPGQCSPRTTPTTPPVPTCKVTYAVTSQWPGGFQASVTIQNTGTAAINGWTLDFMFPNGQTVSHLWSGVLIRTTPTVTVANASFNSVVAPNASVWFGFIGNWGGTINSPPTTFLLNGRPCTVG